MTGAPCRTNSQPGAAIPADGSTQSRRLQAISIDIVQWAKPDQSRVGAARCESRGSTFASKFQARTVVVRFQFRHRTRFQHYPSWEYRRNFLEQSFSQLVRRTPGVKGKPSLEGGIYPVVWLACRPQGACDRRRAARTAYGDFGIGEAPLPQGVLDCGYTAPLMMIGRACHCEAVLFALEKNAVIGLFKEKGLWRRLDSGAAATN